MVVAWPAAHFGYRSADVREMATLLEETISGLRADSGMQRFDFSLVAVVDPPNMPLLPPPSVAQTIEQAMVAARTSDIPAERLSLLRSVLAIIEETDSLPAHWKRLAKASAEATLKAELDTERRYSALSRSALSAADRAVGKADVRGVERAIGDARRRDARYGGKRPDEVKALLTALEARLDSARRLRVMRDQWTLRSKAFKEYREAIDSTVESIDRLRARLDDIRAMAGPPVGELPGLVARLDRLYRDLVIVKAPAEMSSAHSTLLSAVNLGMQAARMRSNAVREGDVKAAWDASSAAAGATMLLAQGKQEIERLSRPPEIK
jgi:hypothetical protein